MSPSIQNLTSDANYIRGRRIRTIYLGEVAQFVIELADGILVRTLELNPGLGNGAESDAVSMQINAEDVVILND
jgi:hypothetical protein